MTANLLTLNSSKSEFLLIDLSQVPTTCQSPQLLTQHHSLLETADSYSIGTSPFLTRSHLSPNLAITIFVSFAVSEGTLISKQLPPSPLSLFTPSLTTATIFIKTCPKPKSHITRLQQIQNSLARAVVKAPKSSHITPIFRSLH